MRAYRHCILLICFAGVTALQASAQTPSLVVERRGNQLHVAAPQLHFLEGKPLERLSNGASVTYILELSLSAGGAATTRLRERFVLSYDLWEEKFSVVQEGPSGRSASHLTAAAAEAWCLDSMPLPLPAFSQEKPFTIKLDCSYADADSAGAESSPSLTLAGLIDVFSRKKKEEPAHWEALSKTIRLIDLKHGPAGVRRPSRRARK
jgi:hypothetical protein